MKRYRFFPGLLIGVLVAQILVAIINSTARSLSYVAVCVVIDVLVSLVAVGLDRSRK
jgi:Na+/proline symporter